MNARERVTDVDIIIIIIIIIKNEKIRVTLCENAAGALYIVNKMCVDGLRNVDIGRSYVLLANDRQNWRAIRLNGSQSN